MPLTPKRLVLFFNLVLDVKGFAFLDEFTVFVKPVESTGRTMSIFFFENFLIEEFFFTMLSWHVSPLTVGCRSGILDILTREDFGEQVSGENRHPFPLPLWRVQVINLEFHVGIEGNGAKNREGGYEFLLVRDSPIHNL